jgi:hypothetical protein
VSGKVLVVGEVRNGLLDLLMGPRNAKLEGFFKASRRRSFVFEGTAGYREDASSLGYLLLIELEAASTLEAGSQI